MEHTWLVVGTAAGDCSNREGGISGVGCRTDRPPDPAATLRQCPSNVFVGPRLVRDTAHCGDRPQQLDSLGCRPASGSSHDSDGSQRSEVASKHHNSTVLHLLLVPFIQVQILFQCLWNPVWKMKLLTLFNSKGIGLDGYSVKVVKYDINGIAYPLFRILINHFSQVYFLMN